MSAGGVRTARAGPGERAEEKEGQCRGAALTAPLKSWEAMVTPLASLVVLASEAAAEVPLTTGTLQEARATKCGGMGRGNG